MKVIVFAWSIFLLLNLNFFAFGSFLPWLTSSSDDSLVLFSVITIGILATIDYVSVLKLIKMFKEIKHEKNN